MLQAGIVFSGIQLGFGIRNFALVNVVFSILWIVVAFAIFREHRRLTKEA